MLESVQDQRVGVVNRRIVLKRNPEGEPKPSDFEVVTEEVPAVAEGQMLLHTKWLTLDPYMRGLDASGPMNNEKSVGSTIVGGTVSEVVESRASGWSVALTPALAKTTSKPASATAEAASPKTSLASQTSPPASDTN